jgi:hypothetical protein
LGACHQCGDEEGEDEGQRFRDGCGVRPKPPTIVATTAMANEIRGHVSTAP